jgi:O-antigen ligase
VKEAARPTAGTGFSAEPLLRLDALRLLRDLVFVGALLLAWVSLRPYPDLRSLDLLEVSSGNDQLTYLAFGGLAATALALVVSEHARALRALASPSLLALGAWLCVGVALSQDPNTSARRFALTAVAVAAAVPLLPRGRAELARLLQIAAWVLLLLCFLGVLLAPDLAIHQPNDAREPLLAGLWRSVFGHKNAAAALMAFTVFIGLYAARAGSPASGFAIAGLSALFLAFTGGKSAMVLCVTVLVLTTLAAPVRFFALRALLCLLPVIALNGLSVGAVLHEGLAAVAQSLPLDATFTGRTDIWRFALDSIAERPLTGHGFAAFWGTEALRGASEGSPPTGRATPPTATTATWTPR